MKAQTLIIFLILSILTQQRVVVQSDLVGQTLDDGDKVTQNVGSYPKPKLQKDTAKWIWGPNARSAPNGQVRVFRESFKLHCNEPLKVYATADNEFKIYINGILVLTGNNWKNTYTTTVDPKKVRLFECDENHLMVEAKNLHSGTPAGLIYQITQEEKCLDCQPGLQFNFRTCTCDCKQSCGCHSPQIWHSIPDCRCGCPLTKCGSGKYLDQDSCSCKCIAQECADGFIWDDCDCKCVEKKNIR